MLIFGSASSAGIFDDCAKAVLDIVRISAAFPADMICQHLDDICAASSDFQKLQDFNTTFQRVAKEIGVRLAPQDVPDKAFGPSKAGTVFGIHYDTEKWTWSIPDKKMNSIRLAISQAVSADKLTDKQVRSLMGKLINIKPLIPAGKYNSEHLMAALADSQNKKSVALTDQCKRQLRFWDLMLSGCNGKLSIPFPGLTPPPWATNVYTDAGGGTLEHLGRGVGGVINEQWFHYPWSKKINSGYHKVDGKKMARKLAALEIIGPLIAVAAAPDVFDRRPAVFWVDNAGAVGAWKKGYSASCKICTTVIKAFSYITTALGCHADIQKIRRCSNTGAILADHLSKSEFKMFREKATADRWSLNREPLRIPPPLLLWLRQPEVDDSLGPRITAAIAAAGLQVLGH
jgi:hypothetical protein